jgi:hypothetical protein
VINRSTALRQRRSPLGSAIASFSAPQINNLQFSAPQIVPAFQQNLSLSINDESITRLLQKMETICRFFLPNIAACSRLTAVYAKVIFTDKYGVLPCPLTAYFGR